ncbi:DNA-binding PucR family transcriptional regulator [Murinocardiopsis flavida]|uniref:DNA-binding PucR family transcriptional regulator n=1 Tax=Murinocardiopsis flavida TaxID=645275 RepID=A0A2P8CPN5_9ACTN|nr:DNA-binding PucR family transcriptional regulator [Murinocardiopsis flavida]
MTGPDPADAGHAQRQFLELLLRDAPAVEYERPLVEARAGGGDPAALAALEQAKVLALRVRTVLADRRRRESELSALFETANDLAGMRNLDQVLHAIVDRARNLLGTDTAYLSLSDPASGRGDTVMRVTSGSVSARFQQLRLGAGEGLGGLVAQTVHPYVTSNYLTDTRFTHTENIDGGVREEGLVAILGVPLQLNGQVIGVLFAADRRERPFARTEIALLGSLATHAAIAIDSANLIDDTRTALSELNSVNRRLTEHSSAVERAAEAHDRLTDLVLRGGGIEEVAAAVSGVLGGTVDIVEGGVPAAEPERAAAVRAALARGRAVRTDGGWIAAAAAGPEPLGTLTHTGAELDDADQRILERAAMVTALLLLMRRSANEAEHRVRGDLLDELIDYPDRAPASLRRRAARLSADLDIANVVVVAEAGDGDAARLRSAAMHIAETSGGLAGTRAGSTVLILPGSAPAPIARRAAADLAAAANGPVTAGAAGPSDGLASFRRCFAEARRCLQTLRSLGRAGEVAAPGDLGFLGLLLGEDRDVDGFVTATLGPLLDYDARRDTALVRTLRAYFACGASPARAKDALHVHVNTVAQRLDRIGLLLGPDWQEPARALELQLALRLHGLLTGGVDLGGPGDRPAAAPRPRDDNGGLDSTAAPD